MNTEFMEKFLQQVGKSLKLSCPLSQYSSFKVGGKADYLVEVESKEELKSALLLSREFSIPHFIIGGGYNLLFDDAGFRGLIMKNKLLGISLLKSDFIRVLSGTTLEELLGFCVKNGLEGIEFLAGIPGTLGGAIYGNAGAFGQCIGNFVDCTCILDEKGKEIQMKKGGLSFGYRRSSLRGSARILLSADINVNKGSADRITARIDENLNKRKEKHPPYTVASAGSYFKNPDPAQKKTPSAAYLLEKVGAKELRKGGAAVSSVHANFIINEKDATARDILDLALELKQRVKKTFGVELEEEVIYLPEDLSRF